MFLRYSTLGLTILLNFSISSSQVQWQESFSNQNLKYPKLWIGDTSSFMINSQAELQLNASSSNSPIGLGTTSSIALNAEWDFYIKLDFSPSSSNFAEIYLMSDNANPNHSLNAYFVRIGGVSGSSDAVSLYKKENGSNTKIIEGREGVAGTSTVEMRVKVKRDSVYQWELFTDTSLQGNYILEGSTIDSSFLSSNYFGLKYTFTSTRADKFYLDEISVRGEIYRDNLPIKWHSMEVLDSSKLLIRFSEIPAPTETLDPLNYRILQNNRNPASIDYIIGDSASVLLDFNQSFARGKELGLEIKEIRDKSQNRMSPDTIYFIFYQLEEASPEDIVISEFMADPTPGVSLPEVEFIEIYNRSNKFIDLSSWLISDKSGGGFLSKYVLFPDSYLLLCDQEDSVLFDLDDPTMGIDYFPTLNNSSDQIKLLNSRREIIDEIEYDLSWYHSEIKSNGGWSIELINPYKNCRDIFNYTASIDPSGGTPGAENSVYDSLLDLEAPELLRYEFLSDSLLYIEFNESIDSTQLGLLEIRMGGLLLTNIESRGKSNALFIRLEEQAESGKYFFFEMKNLFDCEGNRMKDFKQEWILPAMIKKGDVVINEILFNPHTGGSDYIELLNLSDMIFSLDGCSISNLDTTKKEGISFPDHLFHPGEFWVVTEDKSYVMNYFNNTYSNRILQSDLPSFNDDKGSALFYNSKGELIDQLNYNENLHFQLLISNEGVSLERIDPYSEAIETNLYSAAESVGFGTPTYQNSQYSEREGHPSNFQLRKEIFSPDHDGFDDLLFLDYQFKKEGYTGSINVLDSKGRLVKRLVNNELFAMKGEVRWDGMDENNRKAPIGIYLLMIDVFHISGEREKAKLAFVLAGMLE